jgi:chromosome segregation ATPase
MSNKSRRDSSLVKSVLALDHYLSELERVGAKINSTDMTSDFDVEYLQKLMNRFTECGQGVSDEVANLSTQLHEARTRAEAIAQRVAGQAELWNVRKNEQNEKLEKFRILGEKVRELNAIMSQFRRPQEEDMTNEERAKLTSNIPAFEAQLAVVIEELQDLQKSARDSRMKTLEKNAESLAQSLQAVREKLRGLSPSATDGSGGQN